MPEIEIQFRSEAEYRRLRTIRDKYGVQWRGMLIQGAKRLEGRALRFALTPDDSSLERQHPTSENVDPGDRAVESRSDIEPHDTASDPDTTITDHQRDSGLFDASGTLITGEDESNHRAGGGVGFGRERIE